MMRGRPVNPRARRNADMVASVPEDTRRMRSRVGKAPRSSSPRATSRSVEAPKVVPASAAERMAATTSGSACPRMSGPHDPMKSMYRFPSASKT
jgi:hypothetical protein